MWSMYKTDVDVDILVKLLPKMFENLMRQKHMMFFYEKETC
jgi:hypothetical protein